MILVNRPDVEGFYLALLSYTRIILDFIVKLCMILAATAA